MSLFIETHIIQNFAPSNLNRDDTGAPKDAIFGGHRRARISSQCLKRAARKAVEHEQLLPDAALGLRTQKLARLFSEKLELGDQAEVECRLAVMLKTLKKAGKKKKDEKVKEEAETEETGAKKTEYLFFMGKEEFDRLAAIMKKHWDTLGEKKLSDKAAKVIGGEIKANLKSHSKAADVALFGRMLADLPEANIDAACQVAHAISTHKVDREFDYFTAMDDLASPEESGAAMIETTEFNSACFYRYAAIDLDKLRANLQGDAELALASLKAYLLATVRAIPSGKQNSFAAHNPPEFVGVVLRTGAPRSLANAFETPVWPKREQSLSSLSVAALAEQEQKLAKAYGAGEWACLDLTGAWPQGLGQAAESLDALSGWLLAQAKARG